ncbi:G-type lectin S-receptor-like serine/threonine-protein kinase LECRK2 [Eucalyptus grandis]|uniref:G-type lectin S-receptor-like serine/threonine-protein kinase LECRK2 n=1 Tax=Eucalyptus grandis TaxID=71139 RepID=UPI00192EF3C1|nr:G-type lectin S-receptor-like serine/threonine-protein kinase LECRK2 [Eucalyptus grandis]
MASVILGILLVLVPLPLSAEAQIRGNLTLGSLLTANDQNSSWLSPLGEFAFGFRRMGTGAHLLAIWFEKIEDKTIVWSANGDNLAPEGSKVQLTANGGLVLTDPRERAVVFWPERQWLSQLDLGANVKARYSEMNYSTGRFLFALQTDGNLVLYATPTPLVVSDAYWATNTITAGRMGFRLIFNQSGQVYVTDRNGTILNTITAELVPTSGYYQRAILEYDGVFRQYIHPKTANSSSGRLIGWSRVSAPVPQNLCTSIAQQIGSGACGFNSYCTLGDDLRPRCQCPPGYTLLDSTNKMNGCIQAFAPQNCNGSRRETDQFDLLEMPNTNWPESDYERSVAQTEDWCREACLADCFCAVAIFGDGICWKKKIPLSNGRKDSSEAGTKALIKVRIHNRTSKSL